MNQELLIKAAALCNDAAAKLRQIDSPEKRASELADTMLSKGLITAMDKERFTTSMASNPEKIAQLRDSLSLLPNRAGAIGEISNEKIANDGLDAWDRFVYQR